MEWKLTSYVRLQDLIHTISSILLLRACLRGGKVTLASGLTLAGGQKIARVYKKNFTGRVTLRQLTCNVRLQSKGLETIRKLTRGGGLTLPGVFTREKVNPSARVTLARR